MTNSRRKGKRLELEWASFLRNEGFESARRGQQYRGGPDSPDTLCDELPRLHFEVKGGKQLRLKDALAQADRERPVESLPVVAWREDRQDWVVIMPAWAWAEIVRESSYVEE